MDRTLEGVICLDTRDAGGPGMGRGALEFLCEGDGIDAGRQEDHELVAAPSPDDAATMQCMRRGGDAHAKDLVAG